MMDDVIAETLLRVLGEQLVWESVRRNAWAAFTLPNGDRGRYFVHREELRGAATHPTIPPSAYVYDAEVDIPTQIRKYSPRYASRAEAKAACERHYVTGRWE